MNFKEDLKSFIDTVNNEASPEIIKKQYLILVKKYHPDTVSEQYKDEYNEYMILLNTVYSEGRGKIKSAAAGKIDASEDPKKQTLYFRKLFDSAKKEMYEGITLLNAGVNHLDRKALSENSFEIMMHYLNAIKLYRFIVKNCTDKVLVDSAEFDIQMLINYNNRLSMSLLQDSGTLIVT